MSGKYYYVYGLYDEAETIRYIGKGCSTYDRTKRHFNKSSNSKVREFINTEWRVEYIFIDSDEKIVLNKERELISMFKNFLYNKTRGGEGGPTRNGTGNSITLKNIKTGELLHFKSQLEASKVLKITNDSISGLVRGKQKHAGRGLYTLPDISTDDARYRNRVKGIPLTAKNKPLTIYDNHSSIYLDFKSQLECARYIGCMSPGDVSSLINGKIKTLQLGRYSLQPIDNVNTSKTIVFDILKKEILKFNSRTEMSTLFGIPQSSICSLIKGRQKVLHGRFVTPQNMNQYL